MRISDRIESKLRTHLTPVRLEIHDDSHKHAGHSGYREGGETHFNVLIVSAAFDGQSRVARQREVYRILAGEMAERVHALQLTTLTPAEAGLSGE